MNSASSSLCNVAHSINHILHDTQCKSKESCPPYVWSEWSTCTRNCEGGRRFRKPTYAFLCMTDDICKQVPNEYEDCNTHPCDNGTPDNRTTETGNHGDNYYIVVSHLVH